MTALRFRALGQLDIIRLWESCRHPGVARGESESMGRGQVTPIPSPTTARTWCTRCRRAR